MYSWLLCFISIEMHEHLPVRFSSPLDRVSFAQTSQCYRVMFVARHSKIARKVRMRQQETYFKRHVTCQFFVSVVKFTDKFKNSQVVGVCQHSLRHYFKGILHFSGRIVYSHINSLTPELLFFFNFSTSPI